MRTVRYLLVLGLCTVWYGTRVLLLALRGVRHRPGGSRYDELQRGWARALLRHTRITVGVEGADQVPDGPAVFISNHASFVDIWALLHVLPGSPRFVAKKEFMYFPVMGLAMRAMGHISIDRANRSSAFAAYDRAAQAIRDGVSAVVFAEGTRSRSGRLLPFKKGPFVLAIAAGAPVVPVFCADTFARMAKGRIAPRSGHVTVRFGRPIATAGLGYEARDDLSRRCREALLGLGAEDGA
jgi:1-acyl-sn-glycerol-3-phosphate acyltransferase